MDVCVCVCDATSRTFGIEPAENAEPTDRQRTDVVTACIVHIVHQQVAEKRQNKKVIITPLCRGAEYSDQPICVPVSVLKCKEK